MNNGLPKIPTKKGVSFIAFHDGTIRVAHNCTQADHDKLVEFAECNPFNDCFSEYPVVEDDHQVREYK